jgi:beta-glucanase (GH16 family)
MLGTNRAQVGWPACGEIDLLEHVGRSGDEVHGALHGPGYSGGAALVAGTVVDDVTAFHTYRVEWRPDSITWSVDGVAFHRVDRSAVMAWPFDQPFHLIANLAIGGTLGGEPTERDAMPHAFRIDHVRVYDPGA